MPLEMRPIGPDDREAVRAFLASHWGEIVVVHDTVYEPHRLPGFLAEADGELIGLVTYTIEPGACEIVTLDSARRGRGIGTELVDRVAEAARDAGCARLWLVTTNDNLNALRFYQKRGFELVAVHPHAVERARLIKPTIPLVGDDGIPLRDELELEIWL